MRRFPKTIRRHAALKIDEVNADVDGLQAAEMSTARVSHKQMWLCLRCAASTIKLLRVGLLISTSIKASQFSSRLSSPTLRSDGTCSTKWEVRVPWSPRIAAIRAVRLTDGVWFKRCRCWAISLTTLLVCARAGDQPKLPCGELSGRMQGTRNVSR